MLQKGRSRTLHLISKIVWKMLSTHMTHDPFTNHILVTSFTKKITNFKSLKIRINRMRFGSWLIAQYLQYTPAIRSKPIWIDPPSILCFDLSRIILKFLHHDFIVNSSWFIGDKKKMFSHKLWAAYFLLTFQYRTTFLLQQVLSIFGRKKLFWFNLVKRLLYSRVRQYFSLSL